MKATLKKVALWGAGGLLGLVGLLACAVWTLLGVGYLNWLATAPSNLRLVEAAERHPLPPGHALTADLEGDRLVARDFARNRILRSSEDDLLVIMDRGGGHLGTQGYIYSEEILDHDAVHAIAFNRFEGRALRRLSLRWWTYDSPEER